MVPPAATATTANTHFHTCQKKKKKTVSFAVLLPTQLSTFNAYMRVNMMDFCLYYLIIITRNFFMTFY